MVEVGFPERQPMGLVPSDRQVKGNYKGLCLHNQFHTKFKENSRRMDW